jgi:NADH:ubiquinone oxidoreductase subunit 2 (subunit N)
MVYVNLFNDSNILLFSYMLIYNLSLIILFWTLFNSVLTNFKTLHSFQGFSFNSFYITTITLIIFSMAGVPPFIGFFSKLFILTLLTNNSFVLLYTLFFVLLFIGLFFYIQNIRFIHSTNVTETTFATLNSNERIIPLYYYVTIIFLTLLIFGVVYIDDLLLIITWVLI